MKLTGIKQSNHIEITPLEIERVTPDSPINGINCNISVVAAGFSGKGEFWAGTAWHDFIQELKNLGQTLNGTASLTWKVGSDSRMNLTIFNLDLQGHLFARVNIASDETYSDKNKTMNVVQTGFEIDSSTLENFIKELCEIWSK